MRQATVERFQVFEKRSLVFAGKIAQRRFGFADAADDFVFHVRDVHHVRDGVALEFESAPDEIAEDERAPVADMRKVVDSRPAAIHADSALAGRREILNRA